MHLFQHFLKQRQNLLWLLSHYDFFCFEYRLQEKIVFVCSSDCSQAFKTAKCVKSTCEQCKTLRIAREAKRINDKDCFFCSDGKWFFQLCREASRRGTVYAANVEVRRLDKTLLTLHVPPSGCKQLFQQELTKMWGKHCQSCIFCQSTSQKLVTAQYGGSTEEFCSDDCRSKYTMLFCHVRKENTKEILVQSAL